MFKFTRLFFTALLSLLISTASFGGITDAPPVIPSPPTQSAAAGNSPAETVINELLLLVIANVTTKL